MEKIIIEEENEEPIKVKDWEKVEKYLEEKTTTGLIVGLLEADKLLRYRLKKKGFPGKNTDEKIKSAKEKFNNLNGLLEARRLKKKILNYEEANINTLDIEEGINAYKQALLDLENESKSRLAFIEKWIIILDYYLPSKWRAIRKVTLILFSFLFLIWFLANTKIGKLITLYTVNFVNILFTWVLAIIILILGILVVIIISLIYFERRKRKFNR